MTLEDRALALLETQWQAIFSNLREGLDVPPGQRLRAEGARQAVAELGLVAAEEQQGRLEACFAAVMEEPLAAGWQELFPFPQLPGFMTRAPVYPSTRDEVNGN